MSPTSWILTTQNQRFDEFDFASSQDKFQKDGLVTPNVKDGDGARDAQDGKEEKKLDLPGEMVQKNESHFNENCKMLIKRVNEELLPVSK